MAFRRGTPGNTFATFPTKTFSFLIDPLALSKLSVSEHADAISLIRDLGVLDPPVHVTFLWPTYIDNVSPTGVSGTVALLLADHLEEVRNGGETRRFTPSPFLSEADRAVLSGESPEQQRRRSLLALADDAQADGLVTDDAVLVARRYDLLQHHRIRLVPVAELADVIEVCAHGHSIFWSAANPERLHNSDAYYYQFNHWKQKRLARG